MTLSSSIHICTCEELRGQVGLHPLLGIFAKPAELGPICDPDRLIYLDLPNGGIVLIEASLDACHIAYIGPIISYREVLREHRLAVWQAGVKWAQARGATAIQIICSSNTDDADILRELGFPVTTEIVQLTLNRCDVAVSVDLEIRSASYVSEQPALLRIASRTLIDSLDIPESIPLHRPEDLLAEWVNEESREESVILVAETRGEMVGLLVAAISITPQDKKPSFHINYIGVAPDHRRKGWGARLLTQLFRLANEDEVERVSVVTDQRNFPAIQMYEKAGFKADELRMPIVFQCLNEQS